MKELLSIYQDKNIVVSGMEYLHDEIGSLPDIAPLTSRRYTHATIRLSSSESVFLPKREYTDNGTAIYVEFHSVDDLYVLEISFGVMPGYSGILFKKNNSTIDYESFILWYY